MRRLKIQASWLVSAARWDDDLCAGAQDNSAFQREVPILQVFNIASEALFDVGTALSLAAETTHLREPGDTGFDECAHVVVGHELREFIVVLDEMRARSDDAHLA